jgi:predicted transcriptional regulator
MTIGAISKRFHVPKSCVQRHFEHATAGTAVAPAEQLALVKPAPIITGTPCRVCPHPGRDAIEADIFANVPPEKIAHKHAGLGLKAIERHRRECVPMAIERSRAVITATNFEKRTSELLAECEEFLEAAKGRAVPSEEGEVGSPDMKAWGVALGRLTSAIELLARLSGQLSPAGAEDALVRSAQWQKFLKAAIEELTPIPGGLTALKRALQRIGA